MVNQNGRVRRASSTVWVVWVALVVAAAWWYPTVRDQWLLPKASDTESAQGGRAFFRGAGGGVGPRGTPVSTAKVHALDVRVNLSAMGNFSALNTAVVRSKVDGELLSIRFNEGQEVKAGAVLAEIDPRAFELALRQAIGQLERDQASLVNAKLDLQRYRDLLAKDAIARQQVETQVALVQQLEGTVLTDQALVDNARLQLSFTHVTAPISGRLGLKQVELGSLVRASDPAGLVTITQTDPMALVFAVPDVHVPDIQRQLAAGQALMVEAFDRDLKPLAAGRVSAVDNAIDLTTGTLKLKALFDNRKGALFPNQFAQVRMQLGVIKHALSVPNQAIQRGTIGTFVAKVLPDNKVKLVKVNLLGSDGDWQAVKPEGDLKEQDTVITDGADRLRDGSRVDVVNTTEPALPSPWPQPIQTPPALPRPDSKKGKPAVAPSPAPASAASTPSAAAGTPAGTEATRPPWMDRLPPEVAAKVQAMTPEERKAFFQRMRERRGGGAP
jgi:multidrug efflux system membrane fusion protein